MNGDLLKSKNINLTSDMIKEFLAKNDIYDLITLENVDKNYSPDEFNAFSVNLANHGKLEISLVDSNLSNLIIANLKFAGYSKVTKSDDGLKIECSKWNTNDNKSKVETWKTIKIEESADLLIEDELIDPFDSYQKFSKSEDCITKPKPCKNCNCGRADKEAQEKRKKIDPNFKPECGKCYLGDAFRCAGCPFRGAPAFEPGEKIEFKDVFQTDVGMLEQETSTINIIDNAVKLNI